MNEYTYLIIGGGMTADAAIQGIRSVDTSGSIGLISAEPDVPYNRPPLSKSLWKGKKLDSIWCKTDMTKVTFHLGREVTLLSPDKRQVTDTKGDVYSYKKLLLATGGSPRTLPFGGDQIIYYRTVADYRRLRKLTEEGKQFVVIGGGFIGSEIAAALAMNKKKVVMVFPGKDIGDRVFPHDLARFVTNYYKENGVEVWTGDEVSGVSDQDGQLVVKTNGHREVRADGVVAGIGIEPNVALAEAAGLTVENGIVVDEYLRASQPDIYAAGDVAAFHNATLGKRVRVEHEDNALTMGHMAGRNMAGESEAYRHVPYFYTDLFELGYEAVGELNAHMETYADWKEENKEGVIYYLHEGRVRGVLLWNVWGQVDAARALMAEPGPFKTEDLKGRLPVKEEK